MACSIDVGKKMTVTKRNNYPQYLHIEGKKKQLPTVFAHWSERETTTHSICTLKWKRNNYPQYLHIGVKDKQLPTVFVHWSERETITHSKFTHWSERETITHSICTLKPTPRGTESCRTTNCWVRHKPCLSSRGTCILVLGPPSSMYT